MKKVLVGLVLCFILSACSVQKDDFVAYEITEKDTIVILFDDLNVVAKENGYILGGRADAENNWSACFSEVENSNHMDDCKGSWPVVYHDSPHAYEFERGVYEDIVVFLSNQITN